MFTSNPPLNKKKKRKRWVAGLRHAPLKRVWKHSVSAPNLLIKHQQKQNIDRVVGPNLCSFLRPIYSPRSLRGKNNSRGIVGSVSSFHKPHGFCPFGPAFLAGESPEWAETIAPAKARSACKPVSVGGYNKYPPFACMTLPEKNIDMSPFITSRGIYISPGGIPNSPELLGALPEPTRRNGPSRFQTICIRKTDLGWN